MAYKSESTLPATGKATTKGTAPSETVTPKGTPRIASIAEESPTAGVTRAPLCIGSTIGALAVSISVIVLMAKRQD
jgi:hypothetical protein